MRFIVGVSIGSAPSILSAVYARRLLVFMVGRGCDAATLQQGGPPRIGKITVFDYVFSIAWLRNSELVQTQDIASLTQNFELH
jgi:hypothetical protein